MRWLTLKKAIYCALRPRFWRQLARGVTPTIEHREALQRFSFRTIVDIGANRGQFASFARDTFPEASIYSFEPLNDAAKTFRHILADKKDVLLFENAIGDIARNAAMYVTTREDSSSLLRPTAMQGDVFDIQVARTANVSVTRLSERIASSALHHPALLKIDVQGGELDVLRGSSDLLHAFDAVYVECSYAELYEGQPLFADVSSWMSNRGFRLAGVFNQYKDKELGPLQADFLFTRTSSENSAGSIAS